MNTLREIAIAKLQAKAGQGPGQQAGQALSHPPEIFPGPWDRKNGGILPTMPKCPAVPILRGRDSGTAGEKAGQRPGQQAGQLPEIDERIASARLREWHANLARLAPCRAPDGFTMGRWQVLCDDAHWLYENFASQLVRDGWSALDVFGVLPWRDGGGVLLDRLEGARNLKLDGEGRAFWSAYGVTSQTCRSVGQTLVSSGLVLVWELPCQ